ncbi:MAG TPA: LLM class flavin-dependent oxidoreductase, partial [Acidimicrobiales bacterium]|nr:LLM class flavin-dependent oxidoreductase [Acidimicrobiales bacterium]
MRLGLSLGYAPPGTNPVELIELAQDAERLGYDSAWASEAWGTDAVTVLSWLAARTTTIGIGSAALQLPARTPACTAMTAATLDLMSGGRFRLGLGTSGPQVVEGWHGQPWGNPLEWTREYVEVLRRAWRKETVELHGSQVRIPFDGPGATGLGKPLALMMRPLRSEIPVYLAATGPRNVSLAFEIAEGWLPIFYSPEHAGDLRPGASPEGFDVAPTVTVVVDEDLAAARDAVRPMLALYVGGMGARGKNFYN